jgi:hypothetical protein
VVQHAVQRRVEFADQSTLPITIRTETAETWVVVPVVLRFTKAEREPVCCHDTVDA